MQRKQGMHLILRLLFVVVFNTFFFIIGGVSHPLTVWISLGFIHFAYLMLILTPRMAKKRKNLAVFGFSLSTISLIYFIVALITGVIFMSIAAESLTATFLVQFGIIVLYLFILIPYLIVAESTADSDENRQNEIEYVKKASAKMKEIMERATDKEIRLEIEQIYDLISSSPVKSHADISQMEFHILTLIENLNGAVLRGDGENILRQADTLIAAVNDRNRQLITLN